MNPTSPYASQQPQARPFEALLQLDTGTHHGPIAQLVVAPGGGLLASAGETTIRLWDVATRRLERLLLGQVAGGTDDNAEGGGVQRIAITPDGRWLIALKPWPHFRTAGETGPRGHDHGLVTEVQVFEIATGNLQARFVHPGALLDLDISPDGRWLALAGNAFSRRSRRATVSVLPLRAVVRAGFAAAPPMGATVAIGAAQRSDLVPAALRFVPATHSRRRAGAEGWMLVAASTDFAAQSGQLDWLRLTPSGELRPLRSERFGNAIVPLTLAVSSDMAAVAAVRRSRRAATGQLVWCLHDPQAHPGTGSGQLVTEAPAAALAFSPSGQHLLVGMSADNTELETPGVQTVQVNAYGVMPGGGFALRSSYYGHDGTVRALAFVDDETAASAGGDNHAIHFWHFAHRIAEPLAAIRGVGRTAYAPGITADERLLFGALPERLLPPGHAPRQQSFALRTRRLSTTTASDWRMNDFETAKWFVYDQAQQVIPLRYSPDAYGDELDQPPDLSLFVGADDEWVLWSRSGFFDASPNGAQRIGYRINRGSDKEALFVPADRFKGFYKPELIAEVVKHGSEARAAEHGVVFPRVDVAETLPPIVELVARGLQLRGNEVRFTFTVESPCPAWPVTRIWILRNERFVWVQAKPMAEPGDKAAAGPRRYTVQLPLRPGANRFSIRAENEVSRAVPVDHVVVGPELPAAELAALQPGRLFILAVGVSDFEAAGTPSARGYRRLRFAHRDAQAVFESFGAAGAVNHAFETVEGKLLTDANANKADILRELDTLCARIRQRGQAASAERDVLFVFLSGHGVRVTGQPDLYFWCHDTRADSADLLEATGVSMLDLGDRITSVPAEVVLVVDACHAAMAGGNVFSGLDPEELARRVHAVNERGMYILNAARSEEEAREDAADRLGVFTAAMLAAARSERFLTQRGDRLSLPMMSLIAGVQQLVPHFSARAGAAAQTPVCRVYGDLLPLTIRETTSTRQSSGAAALPKRAASPSVPDEGHVLVTSRKARMVTKKAPAKKAAAKKAPVKAAPAKKAAAKTAPAKKAAAKKAPAKKAPAKKPAVKAGAKGSGGGKGGMEIGRQIGPSLK